jgi:hypothetical protein
MTGENQSTWRKTYLIVSLSNINPTRTYLGSNTGLSDNYLSDGTPCRFVLLGFKTLGATEGHEVNNIP